MKNTLVKLIFISLLSCVAHSADSTNSNAQPPNQLLTPSNTVTLVVIGQGLSPTSYAQSPYHAIALAKRAAIADAYRLLSEKLYGVRVEGVDVVKNMILERSNVRTCVSSIIQYANIVETKCARDFCEVEMELKIKGPDWYYKLAQRD